MGNTVLLSSTSLDGNTNYPIKHYIAHRLTDKGGKSITQYKMMEAWEEIEDPLLEGMKTLKPTWAAFCGFVK